MSDRADDIDRATEMPTLASAIPGLTRVAVSSMWRAAQWSATTYVETVRHVAGAVAAGEPPAKIVAEAVAPIRQIAREAIAMARPVEPNEAVGARPEPRPSRLGATTAELRAKGAELLYDSADVWYDGDTHPAYARILDELSPDEARILRFLAINGPQPSIDVRTSRPFGVGSELVAGGLSMIGLKAGVRNVEGTKAELNNLYRLGLIWFSREQVADPSEYQVVEVQPDAQEAIKRAGRSHKTVHRSIELTPFGEDFCQTCLPLDPP